MTPLEKSPYTRSSRVLMYLIMNIITTRLISTYKEQWVQIMGDQPIPKTGKEKKG